MLKKSNICIIIPAYNEESSIASVIFDIKRLRRQYHILVVNDGSTDNTRGVVEKLGVEILNLPFNLGIGGAVQAGLRYAVEKNFNLAVQIDADGQHDPKYIPALLKHLKEADLVVGSRYLIKTKYKTPLIRLLGIKMFSELIYLTCGKRIYDSSSGYKAYNLRAINFFANYFPEEFPDPPARVSFLKNGYRIKEVPVEMRQRTTGKSSFGWLYSLYLLFSVSISILLESVKVKRNTYG